MLDPVLNDPINLKDLILAFTTPLRFGNPKAELDTLVGFLERLLDDLGLTEEEYPDLPIKRLVPEMQKLLSGNISPRKMDSLSRAICSGKLDAPLKRNILVIVRAVSEVPGADAVWDDLLRKVSALHFQSEEILLLEERIRRRTEEGYVDSLLLLVKHCFARLDTIPAFAGRRIYEEAQTYDFDQPVRFRFLREAADYGNKQAALEYGNYMNRTRKGGVPPQDAAEAFRYTMMALPLPSAMWNLAYQLECLQLSREQVDELWYVLKINDKLRSTELAPYLDELKIVSCDAAPRDVRIAYEFAYRINFYLAYTGFAKGFNSMAKFLSVDRYCFNVAESEEFGDKKSLINRYYREAIAGGCVSAMQNMGITGYKEMRGQIQNDPYQLRYTQQLLQTAAHYGLNRSIETLGMFYVECLPEPDYDRARKCFIQSTENTKSGAAYYWLAKTETSWKKKISYLRMALDQGYAPAAYDYAIAEQESYERDGDLSHIRKAISALEQHAPGMEMKKKIQALAYCEELSAVLINKTEKKPLSI